MKIVYVVGEHYTQSAGVAGTEASLWEKPPGSASVQNPHQPEVHQLALN